MAGRRSQRTHQRLAGANFVQLHQNSLHMGFLNDEVDQVRKGNVVIAAQRDDMGKPHVAAECPVEHARSQCAGLADVRDIARSYRHMQ